MEELQKERLKELLEDFREDSEVYRDLAIPADTESQQKLLRSFMNIRMPKPLPEKTLRLQDAYLRQRAIEKGIVTLKDIPLREGVISLWQGDITRLAVDAVVNAANSQMLGCFIPLHGCIDKATHIRITHLSNSTMASC